LKRFHFKTTGGFKNRLTNIWYNKQLNTDNSPNVLEYNGGPGSILGVGQTNIKFADQRTGDRNPLLSSNPSFFLGTGHKNKHLNPQSKELKPKLKGVTEFASKLLPSENDKKEISGFENPNRITEEYNVLDRENEESSNANKNKHLNPQSKELKPKLKGVTEFASKLLPSENDKKEISGFENPNRITEKYNVLDRSNEESSNAINKTTKTLDGAQTAITQKINYSNAISPSGSSKLYNSLVKSIGGKELDNDFINGREFFNVYDPNITPGNTWPKNTPLQSSNGSSTYTQTQLIDTTPVSKEGKLQDFREPLLDGKESSTIMSLAPSYNPAENKTIEGRVNLGNPGDKARNRLKYSTSTEILDKINAKDIYEAELPDHSSTSKLNDLAKFSIGIVNNSDSSQSNYINFRAFLDSFDDQFAADWGSTQYVGRADKFHNYKGFDRTINMSWTVFAQSKAELIPMYKKLNYLASSLSPRYSSGGFMQGNLARLTVGGYLYNQLGIIKGINYSIPEESPWEIGIDEEGKSDPTVKELPHMIKVTGFQFIPIQDFVPQKSSFLPNNVQTSRYISLANGSGASTNNYDS
jgi:hypothetical protein